MAGMGVNNNETGIGTATTNYITTYCRIPISCETVVDIKGNGIIHVYYVNGQDNPIFLFNLSEKVHVEMLFQLDNNALQISTSFNWHRRIVTDPNKIVSLKLVLREGSLETLITANGQIMLKQYTCTEISDTCIPTEESDDCAEVGKDEDADDDDQDLVYIEVSVPDEAPDEEETGETEEAIVNKNDSAMESAEGAVIRMKQSTEDSKDDDADDDEEEDYVEIYDPDSSGE